MAIIAALSVVYSNLGIKVLHANSDSNFFISFLNSKFAETPPAMATFLIPVFCMASFNLSIKAAIIVFWTEAHISF